MHDRPELPVTAEQPLDRLARDLTALDRPDANHRPVTERLTALLGADLLAAIRDELRGLDVTTIPVAACPRRVA